MILSKTKSYKFEQTKEYTKKKTGIGQTIENLF